MKTIKRLALATAVTTGLWGTGALAAEQGTLGTYESQGKFDITLYNETEIKVFGLIDVDIVNDSNNSQDSGAKTGVTDVCVYANVTDYTVSLASTAFELSSGSDTIPYSLTYAQGSTTETWSATDNPSGEFSTAAYTRTNTANTDTCEGSDTKITVSIAEADYKSKGTGVYSDTVTVTVAPL